MKHSELRHQPRHVNPRIQDIKFLNWYSLIVTRYVKYRPGLHKYVQTGLLVCAPWARSNG